MYIFVKTLTIVKDENNKITRILTLFKYSTNSFDCRIPITKSRGSQRDVYISWLTNSALVHEPKCVGRVGGCEVSANEYSYAHGAQINF